MTDTTTMTAAATPGMTAPGAATRSAPYVLGHEDSVRPQRWTGGRMWLRLGAAQSAGALSVYEAVIPVGAAGPPLHVHDAEDEALYVLEGSVVVRLGDERHELGAGSFAWMPRGVPHAFANLSDAPARGLGLCLPGGIEDMFLRHVDYFASLAEGQRPDPARIAELTAPHGRVVGPPLRPAAG